MRSACKTLSIAISIVFSASIAFGATITGTVKGPDGAPFEGAFVQAQNARTRIAIGVLSERQRHYRVVNLPAGENRLQLRAVGFKADPQTRVTLTAEQNASCESTLQKGTVQWNELSMYRSQAISRSKGKGRTNRPLLCLPRFRVADGVGAPRRSGGETG
jgi:hypothetical protein